jgi:hypothetical protein
MLRGSSPGMGGKTKVLLISTGLSRAVEGFRLIVESVTFATTLVSLIAVPRGCWRHFEEEKL